LVVHEIDPPPANAAVQVAVAPVVGPLILIAASQPVVETMTLPGSWTLQ
jgi:hypothetical protein